MILFLDNYDSFTYNIVQYFKLLGADIAVYENDALTLTDISTLNPDAIVLGPGPGTPSQAGITLDCIQYFADKLPILGICLGHQAIAQAFGADVVRADQVMHGRTSSVYHDQNGLFKGIRSPTLFTRYHSLLIDKQTLPQTFEITAWTRANSDEEKLKNRNDCGSDEPIINEIMGIRHQQYAIEGVQFHPESILSEHGLQLLNNFLIQYDLV